MTDIAPSSWDSRGRLLDDGRQPVRQQIAPTDDPQVDGDLRPPPALGDGSDGVGGDLGDGPDLVFRPPRFSIDSAHRVISRMPRSAHQSISSSAFSAPAPMPRARVGIALRGRPASIAVHDHRDVGRPRVGPSRQPRVRHVEGIHRLEGDVPGATVERAESGPERSGRRSASAAVAGSFAVECWSAPSGRWLRLGRSVGSRGSRVRRRRSSLAPAVGRRATHRDWCARPVSRPRVGVEAENQRLPE